MKAAMLLLSHDIHTLHKQKYATTERLERSITGAVPLRYFHRVIHGMKLTTLFFFAVQRSQTTAATVQVNTSLWILLLGFCEKSKNGLSLLIFITFSRWLRDRSMRSCRYFRQLAL